MFAVTVTMPEVAVEVVGVTRSSNRSRRGRQLRPIGLRFSRWLMAERPRELPRPYSVAPWPTGRRKETKRYVGNSSTVPPLQWLDRSG